MTAAPKRLSLLLLTVAILLLAAGLRFHRLGAQSLWYDEGVAYAHSQRALPELIPRLQRNVHVPAYFALLGWWQTVAGASEFALRAFSAFCSIISVAWAFALGKRLFQPAAGLAAAALVALNSFSIYYAQEARMYAMLAALAGGSMWLFIGFMRRRSAQWHWAIGLGLLNALGLYTHVVFALVILAQGLLAALWLGASFMAAAARRRSFLPLFVAYCLANLLTLLCFAPWLPTSIAQVFAQPNLSEALPGEQVLGLLFRYFALGNIFETGGTIEFALYLFLLFGLLPAPAARHRAWWNRLLPVVWLLITVAAYLYLELSTRYLRFTLPAQLAFALWLGQGFCLLWRLPFRPRRAWLARKPKLVAALALGALLLTLGSALPRLYHQPEFQRDDMRGLAQAIQADLRPKDAIIVSAAGLQELLGYYYAAEAPIFGLPTTADDAKTESQTLDIINAYNRLHVIFYGAAEQDPNQIVEQTLNRQAYEIRDTWVDDLRYVQYLSQAALAAPKQVELAFGADITLHSYALGAARAQPGEALPVQFIWQARHKPSQRYKVFLQLLDAEGKLVEQRDSEPVGGSAPTTSWQPGARIVDRHALDLPPDLPAGDYRLIAGLYDSADPAARLPVNGASYLELAAITLD